jgi:predicted ATP-grasp superfamily ATP-dependent carboligase
LVLAVLRPWIDVNNVGSLLLKELKERYGARRWGELAMPGRFYDFTRYRPVIDLEEGIRGMAVPNTTIYRAKREGENDLLLLRLLEPHNLAEVYIASVMKLLKAVEASRYVLLGSMYDAVPHTRPLLVSGYGMGAGGREDVARAGAAPITYRGPSSLLNLITKEAADAGIDAAVFIVSLPQYVAVDEDHQGKLRLLELLSTLYNIPIAGEDFEKAREQMRMIDLRVETTPEAKLLLPQLEKAYDARVGEMERGDESSLSDLEEIFRNTPGHDIGKA